MLCKCDISIAAECVNIARLAEAARKVAEHTKAISVSLSGAIKFILTNMGAAACWTVEDISAGM